ncbi:unnamed protein product [Candidula unifasciata]|uniref:Uncharacterized protein n=1 Tax=Candidula unifasciata TaxID=100452 RepID=A0A8S3ZE64_9EUPU|nr:unnamed protein product [Candidula unifasciata]
MFSIHVLIFTFYLFIIYFRFARHDFTKGVILLYKNNVVHICVTTFALYDPSYSNYSKVWMLQTGNLLIRCATPCFLVRMFTIKFKREFIRCCYCLRGRWRRRRQEDSNGVRKSLLVPRKRNSESSTSSKNNGLMRTSSHLNGVTPPGVAGCRYSFVSPLAEIKASSSRGSLSSVGREDRVNFFISVQRR